MRQLLPIRRERRLQPAWVRRLKPALLFVVLPFLASAQGSITVAFKDVGDREVWVGSGNNPVPIAGFVVPAKMTQVDATVPSVDPNALVVALDKATGNASVTPLAKVRKVWNVGAFDRVGTVRLRIVHGDLPVAAAQVGLKHAKGRYTELLDPSSKGEVSFYAVSPGSVTVTVDYKADGKPAAPVTQVFTLSLKRNEREPTLTIALPEKAATVGSVSTSAPEAGSNAAEGKKTPDPSPIGKFVAYLLGIAMAIGAVFLAIQYMKNNSNVVTAKLEELGVQIPKPGDGDDGQPADLPSPTSIPMPEPPQKILLDNAAPDILASPMAATAVATGVPRLLNEAGDELPLDDGTLTVGRDPGLGLSLVGESTVSRQHATISRSGSLVAVKDLGSTNGTYVNGVRLNGEADLKPGDIVQFGSVRFRFEA